MKIKKFNEGKNFDEFMKNHYGHYGSYREYIESIKQKEGESEEDYIKRMKEYKKGFRNPYDDYMDNIRRDDMRRRMEEGKKGKFSDEDIKKFGDYKLSNYISRERITDIFNDEDIEIDDIKFTKSSFPHSKRFITFRSEYNFQNNKGQKMLTKILDELSEELGYKIHIENIERIGGKYYGCDYDPRKENEEAEGYIIKLAVRLNDPIVKNLGDDDDSQFEDDFEE